MFLSGKYTISSKSNFTYVAQYNFVLINIYLEFTEIFINIKRIKQFYPLRCVNMETWKLHQIGELGQNRTERNIL